MKKMFVLLLALSLTFMMVLPASAATSTENNIPSNPNAPVYRPEDFDYQRAYQSDAAKMAQSQALTALQPEHTRASSSWYTLQSTYTMVGQLYSNYCVPASVRSILGYNNGGLSSAPSQSTIASALGTGAPNTTGTAFDLDMLDYVNEQNQSGFDYAWHEKTKSSVSDMQTRIKMSVDLYDMPPMLWVISTSSSEWGIAYNHAVTVNQISGDKATIGIGDPWPMYSGSGNTFYTISANGVYQGLQAMIW